MAESTSYFQKITIKGFRRLVDVELSMRPMMVMIGVNGSGKTSFLDAWSMLSASSTGQLAAALSRMGGISYAITRDKADRLEFELESSVSGHAPLKYHLSIEPQTNAYYIARETLIQENKPGEMPFKHIESSGSDIRYYDIEDKKLLKPNWEHRPLETSLSQVPRMFKEPENLRKTLASCSFYASLDTTFKAPIRLPQTMQPTLIPSTDGQDLVSCLYYLRETDHSRFELLEDTLSTAFADFERLDFPPVAAGMLAMTWKDKSFSRPIYTHQLSEGTLRFLWLATVLISQNLPAITLIDEPEVSMHPELLSLLADLMRDASKRTQLIVATHSDRLIRFLRPEEVVAIDVEDGEAKLTWADSMDIDHWLKDYTLDEIWAMRRLGAHR